MHWKMDSIVAMWLLRMHWKVNFLLYLGIHRKMNSIAARAAKNTLENVLAQPCSNPLNVCCAATAMLYFSII